MLDHALLVAGAAVNQAATPTAMIAQRMAQEEHAHAVDSLSALAELFSARDADAALHLEGSFHPRVAHGAGRITR